MKLAEENTQIRIPDFSSNDEKLTAVCLPDVIFRLRGSFVIKSLKVIAVTLRLFVLSASAVFKTTDTTYSTCSYHNASIAEVQ